jgi:hypothetical protein
LRAVTHASAKQKKPHNEPLKKYQPLIDTLRAVHRLFDIDEPPNAGHVGYVKSEFLKHR